MQVEYNREIYLISDRIIDFFRCGTLIYIFLINIILISTIFSDDNKYSSSLDTIALLYFTFSSCYAIIYSTRLKRNSNNRKKFRALVFFLRIIILLYSFYGLFYWFIEKYTTTSFLYYLLAFIFTTNIFCAIIILIIKCLINYSECIVPRDINFQHNEERKRKQTILSIVEDTTDVQTFANVFKISKYNETTCVICWDEFKNNDIIKILPCNHYFHNVCIDIWLEKNATCPQCRYNILEEI